LELTDSRTPALTARHFPYERQLRKSTMKKNCPRKNTMMAFNAPAQRVTLHEETEQVIRRAMQ